MCHMQKAGWEVEGMWHDGGQDDTLWHKKLIGKVLAEEFAIFGIKLSFLTNIPYKRILKQFFKSVHGLCQFVKFNPLLI